MDWIKMAGLLDTSILIKGSRGIQLEKVVEFIKKEER